MPYKEALKLNSPNPKKKAQYTVINWPHYNQSLKKRGALSLYFPNGDLRAQFINDTPYIKEVSGQLPTFSPAYIEVMYTFYRVLNFGIRQLTGYFEDLWKSKNLKIQVPSFGHLSDLFATLPLKVKQFCNRLTGRINNGEAITLILDSSGVQFSHASHWYERKYNKPCKQRPWRKLHISMDPEQNMYGVELTESITPDILMMNSLIFDGVGPTVDKVIADGGYYSIDGVEGLNKKGITPVIPPPRHSVVHGKPNTSYHDKGVLYIKDKGTVYAFHKKYNYGIRSRIEAQFSRIKRSIGHTLKTHTVQSQQREAIIIANLINRWNSFGQCISVKTP
jgi:hypothetical protein